MGCFKKQDSELFKKHLIDLKSIIYVFIICLIYGCSSNNPTNVNESKTTDSINQRLMKPVIKKTITNYMSDSQNYKWKANNPDTTKNFSVLTFHNRYATYNYNKSCQYYYYINKTSNKTLNLFWSTKNDCNSKFIFLGTNKEVEKSPTKDDLFASYTLINDSLISVRYYFPKWVNEINKTYKDSIFPSYMSLINEVE